MADTLLRDRALIRLSGEDVRGFLQSLVTNDVAGALPVWAGLLTPQGKALFDFIVWADDDDVLIDCEVARADALAKRLALYRLRRPITIAPDPALAVHWSPHPHDGAAPDPRLPVLGWRWIAPTDDGAGQGDAAAAWQAHRLALGVAEGVEELGDGSLLWLECNAADLHGVSFSKGCYVGQENTARMNWRQKVNRRIAVVPLAEANPARQLVARPGVGLSVEHRRVAGIPDDAWRDWMGPRGEQG